MQLTLHRRLPFVTARVIYRGARAEIANVLVDTGSTGTIIDADLLAPLGIHVEPTDKVHLLNGVGGIEYVFSRRLDEFVIGDRGIADFKVEIGAMDYGFAIGGILGNDFLVATGAVIDLKNLTLELTPA